jgi:hypothetical protein
VLDQGVVQHLLGVDDAGVELLSILEIFAMDLFQGERGLAIDLGDHAILLLQNHR